MSERKEWVISLDERHRRALYRLEDGTYQLYDECFIGRWKPLEGLELTSDEASALRDALTEALGGNAETL